MNIRQWAARIKQEFWNWGTFNSYPREPARYCEVLDSVQGMTTPSNMHMLNLAVQELGDGECYLEVGTWRGATLIGALLGNDAYGLAIDNDVMDDHDGDERSSQSVWRENVERFGMTDRTLYIDDSVPSVWEWFGDFGHTIGVYFFDGDKATEEAAYEGLAGVLPFLANEALIIVDDGNQLEIRRAVTRFVRENIFEVDTILDLPTAGNCWPCWWNGVILLAFYRRQ